MLLGNYLKNWKQKVVLNGFSSSWKKILTGVTCVPKRLLLKLFLLLIHICIYTLIYVYIYECIYTYDIYIICIYITYTYIYVYIYVFIYLNEYLMTYPQSVKCLLMERHFFQKWKIPAYLFDLNYELETINQ